MVMILSTLTMGTKTKGLALVLVALFLTSLVTLISAPPANAALSWNVEQVKEYVWAGGDCPIVVDQNNTSHIAYLDGYTLIYANNNGSEWTNQSIATDAIYLIFSLVLDTNGYPHLLYERKLAGPLMIANWNGKSWDFQNIGIAYLDPATHEGIGATDYATLALDTSGNPSIVYTTFTTVINNPHDWAKNTKNTSLKYAMWTGTSWNTKTVDTVVNDSLSSISLALGKYNQPYILYSPSSNSSNVKLATSQGSNWKIQTALLPPSTGNYGNLVVDSKNSLHFICSQPYQNSATLSTIFYASYDGNAWNTETIASKVNLGTIGELALDSHDYPHFTYRTSDDKTMYVAYSDNVWEIQTLASNIGVGDLALDSGSNPRLLFRTYSPARYSSHLMYATATETTQTPSPTVQAPSTSIIAQMVPIIVAVVILAVIIVSLILYRRHRKPASFGSDASEV